jgi:choline kinase
MPVKPTLLVLAAGMGSRFGGDKQLNGIGPSGEYILDYSVYDAWKAGFGKVVFVIRPELEADLRTHFGTKLDGKMEIEFCYQNLTDLPAGFELPEGRTKPWGTGHAILCCEKAINEPFAVVNADDLYGAAAYKVLAEYLTGDQFGKDTFAMVAYKMANTLSPTGGVSRGVCQAKDGFLAQVIETHKIEGAAAGQCRYPDPETGDWQPLAGDSLASMNFWGFHPVMFSYLRLLFIDFLQYQRTVEKSEFLIPTVVDTLIKAGLARTRVLTSNDKWFGMTYREDREPLMANVRELVAAGRYPANLWA